MSDLFRSGHWPGASAFHLLVEETPTQGPVLREGQDFSSQRELSEAGMGCERTVLPELSARLVVLARTDTEAWAICGSRPSAADLVAYPAWRVDLWRCL